MHTTATLDSDNSNVRTESKFPISSTEKLLRDFGSPDIVRDAEYFIDCLP